MQEGTDVEDFVQHVIVTNWAPCHGHQVPWRRFWVAQLDGRPHCNLGLRLISHDSTSGWIQIHIAINQSFLFLWFGAKMIACSLDIKSHILKFKKSCWKMYMVGFTDIISFSNHSRRCLIPSVYYCVSRSALLLPHRQSKVDCTSCIAKISGLRNSVFLSR